MTVPIITLREEGPIVQRYSPDQILSDLRDAFPRPTIRAGDTIEELMWVGGQQRVVDWLERYLNQ